MNTNTAILAGIIIVVIAVGVTAVAFYFAKRAENDPSEPRRNGGCFASGAVVLGLFIVVGSVLANALLGTQIALIGIGFILTGIFIEIRARI